jgi:hypothetical protein
LHLETIHYKLNEKLIPIFDNCPKFNYNQGKRLPGDKNLVKIGGLKMSTPQMISYRILLRKEPDFSVIAKDDIFCHCEERSSLPPIFMRAGSVKTGNGNPLL